MTTIALKPTEAALILDKDGVRLVLPDMESDEFMPDYCLMTAALAWAMTEADNVEELKAIVDKFVSRAEEPADDKNQPRVH